LLSVQPPGREPETPAIQALKADFHPGAAPNLGPERLGITLFCAVEARATEDGRQIVVTIAPRLQARFLHKAR
jgi:ribosomal protein L11